MTIGQLIVRIGVAGAKEAHSAITAITSAFLKLASVASMANALFASNVAVTWDEQVRALAAYQENAVGLTKQLERLRQIAKMPGLGLEEVQAGVVKLEAAGFSANLAERAIRSFGNAVALSGGGKQQLAGITTALAQIAAKGVFSAEEISQIAERLPQIRTALKDAFGTANTELIQKMGYESSEAIGMLINSFEKLPQATTGYRVSIDNLWDDIKIAVIPLGRGLMNLFISLQQPIAKALAMFEAFSTEVGIMFNALADSGVVAEVLTHFLNILSGQEGNFRESFAEFSSNVLAFFYILPEVANNAFIGVKTGLRDLQIAFAKMSIMWTDMMYLFTRWKGFKNLSGTMKNTLQAITEIPNESMSEVSSFTDKQQEYFQRIMSAYKPMPDLPNGLYFGGENDFVRSNISPQNDIKRIEYNTRKTAEALERRMLGGGVLAQLGVTGAEMRASNMMAGTGYSATGNAVTGGNWMERHMRRMVMDEIRRTGAIPMPR